MVVGNGEAVMIMLILVIDYQRFSLMPDIRREVTLRHLLNCTITTLVVW